MNFTKQSASYQRLYDQSNTTKGNHTSPSRVLRKIFTTLQRKRQGKIGVRHSCQVLWQKGTRTERIRGAPNTPTKAVLLNWLANN